MVPLLTWLGVKYYNATLIKMIKFKIGDKVRVVACVCGHNIEIGDEVIVERYYNGYNASDGYIVTGNWAVEDEELEPAE